MGVLHGSIPWLAIAVRQNKNSQEGVERREGMEKIKYGVLGSSKIFHTRKSALTHANLLGYPRSAVFLIIPQGMTQKMIDKVN